MSTKAKTTIKKVVITTGSAATAATAETVKNEVKRINLESLFPTLGIDQSVFVTKSRGRATEDTLLKEELVKDLSKDQKKKVHRHVRVALKKFALAAKAYNDEKDAQRLTLLKNTFDSWYQRNFRVNDYSVNSLTGGNTKAEKVKDIEEMLDIFKSFTGKFEKVPAQSFKPIAKVK